MQLSTPNQSTETSPDPKSVLKIHNTFAFAKLIGKMVEENHCTHLEAVCAFAEENGMEYPTLIKLIDKTLRGKIREEATERNLIPNKKPKVSEDFFSDDGE